MPNPNRGRNGPDATKIQIRVSSDERDLLRRAGEILGRAYTDWVRDIALAQALTIVLAAKSDKSTRHDD